MVGGVRACANMKTIRDISYTTRKQLQTNCMHNGCGSDVLVFFIGMQSGLTFRCATCGAGRGGLAVVVCGWHVWSIIENPSADRCFIGNASKLSLCDIVVSTDLSIHANAILSLLDDSFNPDRANETTQRKHDTDHRTREVLESKNPNPDPRARLKAI